MADFPYVQTAGKFPEVFEAIRNRAKPPKVTYRWLEAAGFKSSSDRNFVSVFKFLGILNEDGTPTDKYDLINAPDWKAHLGTIIRESYTDIFGDYPSANTRTKAQLIDQFRPIDTNATKRTLELKVTTFLKLCDVAEFSGEAKAPERSEAVTGQEPVRAVDDSAGTARPPGRSQHLTVNVNLCLEIPAVEKPDVYDMIFKSMAEHLGTLLNRRE